MSAGDTIFESTGRRANLRTASVRLCLQRMHAIPLHALSPSALLAAQVPRRSLSQQGIERRLDSAGDTVLGPARRQGISRTALAGFDSALPVIYSAQASEAAVSPCRLSLVPHWLQALKACGNSTLSSSKCCKGVLPYRTIAHPLFTAAVPQGGSRTLPLHSSQLGRHASESQAGILRVAQHRGPAESSGVHWLPQFRRRPAS